MHLQKFCERRMHFLSGDVIWWFDGSHQHLRWSGRGTQMFRHDWGRQAGKFGADACHLVRHRGFRVVSTAMFQLFPFNSVGGRQKEKGKRFCFEHGQGIVLKQLHIFGIPSFWQSLARKCGHPLRRLSLGGFQLLIKMPQLLPRKNHGSTGAREASFWGSFFHGASSTVG